MASRSVRGGGRGNGGAAEGGNNSLVSSLVRRLNQVERELAASRARSKQQEDDIALLRTQLAAAEARQRKGDLKHLKQQQRRKRMWGKNANAGDASSSSEEDAEILRWRAQAKKAWRLVGKMKEFLQDYGLVWVGDGDDDDDDNDDDYDHDSRDNAQRHRGGESGNMSVPEAGEGRHGDENRMLRDISARSDRNATEFGRPAGRAASHESGLNLGPSASVDDSHSQRGPSRLTNDFIDGDAAAKASAPPMPHHDGSRADVPPQPKARHPSNIHGLDSIDANASKPVSKANFLNKLPAAVIRNGKVIEVRSEIAGMFDAKGGGNSDGPIALTETIVGGLMRRSSSSSSTTTAASAATHRGHARSIGKDVDRTGGGAGTSSAHEGQDEDDEEGRHISRSHGDNGANRSEYVASAKSSSCRADDIEVVTVQVKTEDRQQTYVLKLAATSTVGSIYRMIDKHRAGGMLPTKENGTHRSYELRGGYPPRLYGKLDMTLSEAGLIPNASLFMTPLSSS